MDAMGGDLAPQEIVKGAVDALRVIDDLEIFLVGQEDKVLQELKKLPDYPVKRITIIDAREVIAADEQAGMAIKRKKDSSLSVAMRMVKEKQAEAVVSAGNTGAFMAGALLLIGRLKGINRPALAPLIPTINRERFMLLDVGANAEARPEHLMHYGIMGNIYVQKLLDKKEPRVGLLNIGTEEGKGNQLTREAFPLLKACGINFIGNVEARNLLEGVADVVVCDGFTGNIVLKLMEGVVGGIFSSLKKEMVKNVRSKLGAVMLMPGLKDIKKRLDYMEYGGAPLLGVKGICIKSHGSSNAKAIKNAVVNQAYPLSRAAVNDIIRTEIDRMS
nr:phosphate acyltransferase PlsX [Candidatus Contubernalis alkalaceticus]